ncbi:PHP domain-containing protein [Oligosphaera ethanolica]|uniref:Metal-dependent phosphoesterase TrpH n=1 Tax=Oligosphaera ethanolica TaxID=760260 RepID=A0AAE3VFC8_9BACT|nr:PHP domain-containing protein [Oligosphaera ethanolica]MDQ0289445.1 putative metal-dependent phosphoesterase TrpH [Oligosphaera ethanolica]
MIDLHCHSTASDGTVAPEEMPALAHAAGLSALALTDHDTIDGVEAFMNAGKKFPAITFLAGVELAGSVSSGEHYHLVGLGIDPANAMLRALMAQLVDYRHQRNEQMLVKLSEVGVDLSLEQVRSCNENAVLGRPHFAKAMVRMGVCRTMRNAFDRYLGRGKPAYVGRKVPSAAECLQALRAAGGVSIWAHPMTSNSMTGSKCLRIVEELQAGGLDGIEAYYPEHTKGQTDTVRSIARERGLLLSGGTDFHGENIPGLRLGIGKGHPFQVPDCLLQPIIDRIAARRPQST